MKFSSNYMIKGRTNTNDHAAVSGKFKLYYGDNFNISVFGSNIDKGTAYSVFELQPAFEANFGLPWHKARLEYTEFTYPDNTSEDKRVLGFIYKIYYDNFTPYIKITKDLNQKKLEYYEGGLKYRYNNFFVKLSFADQQTIKESTEAASSLNGQNAELSVGYNWDHYTLTVFTNNFTKDNFTSGTTSKSNAWVSFAYKS